MHIMGPLAEHTEAVMASAESATLSCLFHSISASCLGNRDNWLLWAQNSFKKY